MLEGAIKRRSEEQRKMGLEMHSVCQICLKTRLVDGLGYQCSYCATKCCARCGGKVTLRSNKVHAFCRSDSRPSPPLPQDGYELKETGEKGRDEFDVILAPLLSGPNSQYWIIILPFPDHFPHSLFLSAPFKIHRI